jgi:hypothetical protein
MMLKSRGSNAIDPGVILKKKEKISMNKGPIEKCKKFRGQIVNSHFSQANDAVFKTLFITFFFTPEKTDSAGKNLTTPVVGHISYQIYQLSNIPRPHDASTRVFTNSPVMVGLLVPAFSQT